jgi:hypothetical protein
LLLARSSKRDRAFFVVWRNAVRHLTFPRRYPRGPRRTSTAGQ